MRVLKSKAFYLLSLFIAGTLQAAAQIDEPSIRRPPPRVKIQKIIKVVKVPEVRYQKLSGVAITTVQPGADITLRSTGGRRPYNQTNKTDSNGVLNLENVPPGKYALTVSADGYVTEESDIDVMPQQLVTVPVNLAPITHDIFIKTNVKNGEVRYARIQKKAGSRPQGIAGYCMVPIQNGTAAVLRMQEGDYSLEVHPEDVEYKMESREITISDQALSKTENAAGQNEIPINLARTVSTEDFLANWLPNEWRLPSGWRIDKRMQVNGAGVALLQNERYNYYKDFELTTGVRLLDNRSVGLVLRALDDQNYYLIQITGSAAAEPYLLTGFIVKNGRVAETLVPTNIKAYASTLGDRKYFNLTITAKGNVFRVTLEDTETGRSFVIGIVEDQNNTFPIGAIGVGSKDASRFEINRFHINYK